VGKSGLRVRPFTPRPGFFIGKAPVKRLPGLLGLGPVEGDYTSTPLSYYDLGAMPWGYRGQPLESLRGVILMPLLDGFGERPPIQSPPEFTNGKRPGVRSADRSRRPLALRSLIRVTSFFPCTCSFLNPIRRQRFCNLPHQLLVTELSAVLRSTPRSGLTSRRSQPA
jgi:hypothetical protein